MFTNILIVTVALVLCLVWLGIQQDAERAEQFERLGINSSKVIPTGKYIYGHPEINVQIQNTFINREKEKLVIYNENRKGPNDWTVLPPESIGSIPIKSVTDIAVEDASTIQHKITIGRMLLTGPLALAWRKKQKNELAYLVITWKDKKFTHETYFEFDHEGGMMLANAARNQLIKYVEND